jgi:O-antigen ligase
VPPDADIAHAHNHILQSALDLGLPGMMAYLWLWVCAARLVGKAAVDQASAPEQRVADGLGIGLIAYFAFGMTDAIPLGAKVGLALWAALALVAVSAARVQVPVADRADGV